MVLRTNNRHICLPGPGHSKNRWHQPTLHWRVGRRVCIVPSVIILRSPNPFSASFSLKYSSFVLVRFPASWPMIMETDAFQFRLYYWIFSLTDVERIKSSKLFPFLFMITFFYAMPSNGHTVSGILQRHKQIAMCNCEAVTRWTIVFLNCIVYAHLFFILCDLQLSQRAKKKKLISTSSRHVRCRLYMNRSPHRFHLNFNGSCRLLLLLL